MTQQYSDILVHVDRSVSCALRIRIAAALAKEHRATLSGLYVRPIADVPLMASSATGPRLEDALHETADHQAEWALQEFRACAGDEIGIEWIDVGGDLLDVGVRQARMADLVVVGQAPVLIGLSQTHLASHLVLHSGRPVLVVPEGEEQGAPPFERVLVAWNGSREIVRAISDAMPILKAAQLVEVLMISAQSFPGESIMSPGGAIRNYMARHEVPVTTKVVAVDPIYGVGGSILARATELNANLIVMGGFGRSKIRETLLGGTSDEVLANASVPIVMSY